MSWRGLAKRLKSPNSATKVMAAISATPCKADVLDAHDTSFVSVTQQFNTTTSMGRLTLNMLLSFAQFEREIAGERIRDKIAASKRKGMWMGGNVPLGYDVKERKLIVNAIEAECVRTIFQRYAALGSVSLLKAELDRLGVVSKRRAGAGGCLAGGKPFSRGALYLLLQNRICRGEITHQGSAYPGQHDAIVDAELWRIVQDRLATNRRERLLAAGAEAPSLLAGLIFDADGPYDADPCDQGQKAISILCLGVAARRRSPRKLIGNSRSSGRYRRTCVGSATTIFGVTDRPRRRPRATRFGCSRF